MRKSLEDVIVKKKRSHLQTGKDGLPKKVFTTVNEKIFVKTVDGGKRFAHLIIDYICFVAITFCVGLAFSIVFKIIFGSSEAYEGYFQFAGIPLYFLFYALFEYYFQQTPGKMVTGYVVIDQYAEEPDLKTCLLRSALRYIPFEPFSCLGSPSRGWHDKWSHTFVVSKEEAWKLKNILDDINLNPDAEFDSQDAPKENTN